MKKFVFSGNVASRHGPSKDAARDCRNSRILFALFFLFVCVSACKSPPASREGPQPSLHFEGVEAKDIEHLSLLFTLDLENHAPSPAQGTIEAWRVEINGREVSGGLSLEYPETAVFPVKGAALSAGKTAEIPAAPGRASFPLRLNLDLAALAAEGITLAEDYRVNLITRLAFTYEAGPLSQTQVSGLAAFPRIQAPVFTITSIAILKAELINPRVRVTMNIDTPHPCPVELSAFVYELYGNGRLWAEGAEKNISSIPPKSSGETRLFLIMNFINMKRDLLDQIINLEDVNYRFTGEVQVRTAVNYLPRFKSAFDLSGYSQVFDN
jgi:LEA14-like dessication related protein